MIPVYQGIYNFNYILKLHIQADIIVLIACAEVKGQISMIVSDRGRYQTFFTERRLTERTPRERTEAYYFLSLQLENSNAFILIFIKNQRKITENHK